MNSDRSSQIIVIGSINTDMVINSPRLPQAGETVLGTDFMMSGGGKGANQAVAAARLGAPVILVGCVGDDLFGLQAKQKLGDESIDCQHVLECPNQASGVALITVDELSENQIVVAPGANKEVSIAQVSAALSSSDDNTLVLMQLEIPLATVAHAIDMAKQQGARVILDPAPAQELSEEVLEGVFLLTPNQTEAERLTGIAVSDIESSKQAIACLLQKGAQNIALTLGEQGVLLAHSGTLELVPASAVEATDSTAAGDCFNGALATALSKGSTLVEATHFACQAAAIAVTRPGAQASMPYSDELDQ